MYDFVSIGDITIDIYFQGETITQKDGHFYLAAGGKYYADYFYQGLGGSGANVAIHAAAIGLSTAIVSRVGENAFKNVIIQGLARKSVSTEFVEFVKEHHSVSTILLNSSGERSIIKYSTPKEHFEISPYVLERISKAKIVFLGNLPDVPLSERITILKKASNEENCIAINLGSKDCKKGLKALNGLIEQSNVLLVNRYEWCELSGQNPEKVELEKNQLTYVKELANADKLTLVVTDSKNGSYGYFGGEAYYQAAEPLKKIIDTTGAGDSFTSAFLISYAEHKDVQKALEAGNKRATENIKTIGAN